MNITIIAGARPNFIKIAPIIHSIQNAQRQGNDISFRLVHTGQHYDKKMSETFFEELDIPQPDINLGCGGGTQIAKHRLPAGCYTNLPTLTHQQSRHLTPDA